MRPHMLRSLILVLSLPLVLAAHSSAPTPSLFTFHSNPWLNLHLQVRAGVRETPAPSGLSAEEREQWDAAVAVYNPYAQRVLCEDGMVAITTALRAAENKS